MNRFSVTLLSLFLSVAACGEIAVKDGERIAFLGASITQFGNADDFGYVNLVVDGFRRAGIRVTKIPAGVSGNRSHMMLARFDSDVAAKKPDWVLVKAGVNDITWQRTGQGNDVGAFETNLVAICDKADKAGIRVMLVKSTLVGERNHTADANNQKLRKYVDVVERLAKARGYLLADAFEAEWKALDALQPKWMPCFTTDNLHLNGRGNILLACEILRAFGFDEKQLAECRDAWERMPSMRSAATFVNNLKKDLAPCEYAALGKLAAEKGETVETYAMRVIREEAASHGAWDSETSPLAAKIAEKWPIVKTDIWHGDGRRIIFKFQGHEAWVVDTPPGVPAAEGAPWTWTMQWATAFVPRTGVPKLLRHGFRHVTLMQFDERMTEKGLKLSRDFQKYLVDELGFSPKANLIGLSWGGFFTVRYAAKNPDCVNRICLDAPLLSFEKFDHDVGPWKALEPATGWRDDPEMPVNMAGVLAKAEIPIFLLYGGSDTVVNPALNCKRFIAAYKAAGGKKISVAARPAFGHHPHGVDLDSPAFIDWFVNGYDHYDK